MNIKKSLSALALSLMFSFGASAATEGVEYQTLPQAAQFNAPNQVVKIYSVNCPFCFKFEKAGIPNESLLPAGSTLDFYHISTKPPFGLEKSTALAVAYTMKGKAVYEKLNVKFFDQYHVLKKKFKSGDEIVKFASNIMGISPSEFNTLSKKPEVSALISKWDQGLAVAKIQGIPAITVNGKYLINTKSIRSMKMLKDLIAELSAK